MTPEQLKASVLQYAVQGKLVEQRTEDGTADSLYQQIQEEKQKLIKEGKIKKEKNLTEITEDEIPYDIPANWKWCRLYELTYFIGGYAYKSSEFVEHSKNQVLRLGNVKNDELKLTAKPVFIPDDIAEKTEQFKCCEDDILITMTGTRLKRDYFYTVKICDENNLYINQRVGCLRSYINYVSNWLIWVLKSESILNQVFMHETGTANQGNLGAENIMKTVIPLPPLAEQKRIAAKIEELLPYIDRYAVAYDKLEAFNAKFPKDMKKSILQYAIQGKLVEQRAEEGTGEALFQQVVTNRETLIKENAIKRDKRTETSVNLEEVPFDIPENWKWVTLGSILNKLTDGTHKTPKYTDAGIKFVSVKDMSNGFLSLENTKFISEEEHRELYARCNPEKGDIILSKVGTTGVPAIVDTDEEFSLFVSVALLKFDHNCIDKKFLYYMLMSPLVQAQATENTRGVGNKNWVLDAIGNTMVVLPPLKEQIRIVDKLEELLPYCDRLVK